jgi:hypothetical protein
MSRIKRAVVLVLPLAALCGFVIGSGTVLSRSLGAGHLRPAAVENRKLPRHPAARLESATQPLPTDAVTPIAFDRVAFDTGHMVVSGKAALRAPRRGIYAVDAGLRFPADPRGIRALMIGGPGGKALAGQEDSANSDPARSTIYAISTLVKLRRGGTVAAFGFQSTGVPMQLVTDTRSFLAMHKVSP